MEDLPKVLSSEISGQISVAFNVSDINCWAFFNYVFTFLMCWFSITPTLHELQEKVWKLVCGV